MNKDTQNIMIEHEVTIPWKVRSCGLSKRQRRIAMFITIPLLGAGVGAAAGVGVDAAVSAASAALIASATHSAAEYAIEATLSTEAHIAIGIAIGFAVLLLAVGIGFGVTQHKKKQKALSLHNSHGDMASKPSVSKSIFTGVIVTASDKALFVKIKGANLIQDKERKTSYHKRLKKLFIKAKAEKKSQEFTFDRLGGSYMH